MTLNAMSDVTHDSREARQQARAAGRPGRRSTGSRSRCRPRSTSAASSGVKSTWASKSGPWMNADATAGCAKSTTQCQEDREHGIRDRQATASRAASALPSRNSSRRIGVVSTGSRVPCWRSPTTAYAANKDRHERRDAQHVQQDVLVPQRARRRRGQGEDRDERLDDEDQWEDRHRQRRASGCAGTPAAPFGRWRRSAGVLSLIAGASVSSSISSR